MTDEILHVQKRKWVTFTSKFLINDSDDELLKQTEDDELVLDVFCISAMYPSKYAGFIKVDTDFGSCYCLKTTLSELKKLINES